MGRRRINVPSDFLKGAKQKRRALPNYATFMSSIYGVDDGSPKFDGENPDVNHFDWGIIQDDYKPANFDEQYADEGTHGGIQAALDSDDAKDMKRFAHDEGDKISRREWAESNYESIPKSPAYKQQRKQWSKYANKLWQEGNDAGEHNDAMWNVMSDPENSYNRAGKIYSNSWKGHGDVNAGELVGDHIAKVEQTNAKTKYFTEHPHAKKKIGKKIH